MNPDPFPAFNIGISQCRPTSSGHVRLTGNHVRTKPEIQPDYLATEHDQQETLEGIRFLRHLATMPTMKKLIKEELDPGPETDGDEALLQHARETGGTVFHPASTCRMGNDPNHNVVDARLRVHGLESLRVADASIFPTMPSGNLNAPAIMVGEKASDIILTDLTS